MRIRNKHLFASALTGRGFCSYWDEVLADLRYFYLLRGSGTDSKSLFLRLLGLALSDRGYSVVYYHLPEDHLALEGLVVRELRAGIVDHCAPGLVNHTFPAHLAVTEIDLADTSCWQKAERAMERQIIQEGKETAANIMQQAGMLWERISTSNRLCQSRDAVRERAASWVELVLTKPSHLKHYFAGAVTAGGPVDYTNHLTVSCKKRYLIKGAPGSGQLAMEEFLTQALSRHYEVEAYHSYLNPEELVLLLLPEIGVAVLDDTSCIGLAALPGDLIWDVSGSAAQSQASDHGMVGDEAELLAMLDEAGRALSGVQLIEPASEVPTSDEEIAVFIARLLKESTNVQSLVGY